ncbi:MAG: fibronectin type III domain-containing protein [Pseudolysinimonas sp.]|uniref:fibronectin type III domain-containing protein n=1 Tax=Pseudolysinimonas sp. TaxID=2680009 RepID=UPI0032668BC0
MARAVDPEPLAARLIAEPYATTGVRVTVSGMSGMAGLTNDGTFAYMLNGSGSIVSTPLADIPLTPGSTFSATGTVHPVQWGVAGAPALPGNLLRLSIAASHGCIFITSGDNTEGSIHLYCISVADWTVTEVAVPASYPLPEGFYYTFSSLIDFPDGRIGKVSKYTSTSGGYQSTLRTYQVTGTGAAVTIAWSEDYVMFDPDNFAVDEHGIATDGTYLYRIQWRDFNPNFKSWKLSSGSSASVSFAGNYTQPFDNMHYLSHNHVANYYMVGHYNGSEFFITSAADPGPGPGNPLNPALGTPTSTTDGCTATISNYDAAFDWSASVSAGSATIDSSGLLSVTGLARGASVSITVSATRSGYPSGSTVITCTSLALAAPDAPTGLSVKPENGRVSLAWTAPADDGGSAILTYQARVLDAGGNPLAPAVECSTATLDYCSMSGLSNGTAYLVEVRASNAIGDSPWSTRAALTPGVPVAVAPTTDPDSADLTLNDHDPVEGTTIVLTAYGFRPGTQVDFWLNSTPLLLGSAIANSSGIAVLSATLPSNFSGIHVAQALGVGPSGIYRNLTQQLTIRSAGSLASTGSTITPTVALASSLVALGLALLAFGGWSSRGAAAMIRRRRLTHS